MEGRHLNGRGMNVSLGQDHVCLRLVCGVGFTSSQSSAIQSAYFQIGMYSQCHGQSSGRRLMIAWRRTRGLLDVLFFLLHDDRAAHCKFLLPTLGARIAQLDQN